MCAVGLITVGPYAKRVALVKQGIDLNYLYLLHWTIDYNKPHDMHENVPLGDDITYGVHYMPVPMSLGLGFKPGWYGMMFPSMHNVN